MRAVRGLSRGWIGLLLCQCTSAPEDGSSATLARSPDAVVAAPTDAAMSSMVERVGKGAADSGSDASKPEVTPQADASNDEADSGTEEDAGAEDSSCLDASGALNAQGTFQFEAKTMQSL